MPTESLLYRMWWVKKIEEGQVKVDDDLSSGRLPTSQMDENVTRNALNSGRRMSVVNAAYYMNVLER